MTTREKFQQINKEAKATLLVLLLVVLFWTISGIGVSRLNITIFHTPLWAITGCIGTWIFSVVAVWILVKKVFKNFDLEEEEEENHA
ncbi:MAG: YhdT family protein [Clostridiales bacterium]|nr:YhdT family protein [Clostridiales bacterium]